MQAPEPSSERRKQDLLRQALTRKTPQEQAAFLDGACGDNAVLRAEVEALLAGREEHQETVPLNVGVAGLQIEGGTSELTPTLLDQRPLTEGPGTVIGRYKLLEQIGEGGFGVVYQAEQREPVKRRVALKIIKLGMDTRQVVARFEAERQSLALMDHANIAKVFDAGATETGRPYFVMELVRGIRITDYCDQNNLPTGERLDLFIKVCQAIQHAHQKGIIHRDIKPSNILVTLHDGMPVPKVIDFGIAKATAGQTLTDKTLFTAFEQFIGTPVYMSPEQAEMSGLDIDTRSDIYSLGVLLYELLAGSTPFDAKELLASGIDAMRKTIREKEPMRPSTRLTQELVAAEVTRRTPGDAEPFASSRRRLQELVRQLKGDLDWIVMKCLEKDRTRRYETANGLAADLKRHLSNEPVTARPPSVAYKLQKAWRRNRILFTAGAAVTAALVIGLGTSSWLFIKESEAYRLARMAEAEQNKLRESAVKALGGEKEQRERADAQAREATQSQQQSRRLLYASDMNLVQQSLRQNNLGRARRLLDRHRPQPGEDDLRGWEWRYLWQLTRNSALVTLTNRQTYGSAVNFSPDGSRLAVDWLDGHLDLWDVPRRRWIRGLAHGDHPHQGHLAFSPVRNLLAATSEPGVVTLYDLDSGRESILWPAPAPGDWRVRDLSFSQDGSRLVIYAASALERSAAVWLVNASSSQIESRHLTVNWGSSTLHGAARLSPDNRYLYLPRNDNLKARYSIRCLEIATGQELWQTEPQRDGLTTLAITPDGRVLASGSGFEDPTIRVWDAATGRLLVRLEGHTGWVCKLVFTRNGRRLISAASDQSIRCWDTTTWTESMAPLRGHTDEVYGVAISETAQLLASAGKDGNLMLWRDDGTSVTDGYGGLSEELGDNQVLAMDRSRVLLLPPGKLPEPVDLKGDALPVSLPEIGSSTNVLGWFGTNILCYWNRTNQILVHELRGAEFVQLGAISVDSGTRPLGFAYNMAHQLLAWTEGPSSRSVYLASLAAPGRRIELGSDFTGLIPSSFSEDGNYLSASAEGAVRVWNVETERMLASIDGNIGDAIFAEGGRVLVVALARGRDHEIRFYDLAHPDRAPRSVPGKDFSWRLAVSPDGGLVASATQAGHVRLFNAAKGECIADLHGHLNGAHCVAFSPDGRRLISTSTAREAVKLWDVGTRQELLTLSGAGSGLNVARWSADGDVILAGTPWQAWRAPSWEEIAAAESKDKTEGQRP